MCTCYVRQARASLDGVHVHDRISGKVHVQQSNYPGVLSGAYPKGAPKKFALKTGKRSVTRNLSAAVVLGAWFSLLMEELVNCSAEELRLRLFE